MGRHTLGRHRWRSQHGRQLGRGKITRWWLGRWWRQKPRRALVELIETVVIYKLPKLSREEIQAMLQVDDIRKTRVYQEAKEEGKEEGREKGREEGREEGRALERKRQRQEKLRTIGKLAELRISPAKIAEVLELDVDVVRKALAKKK